MERKKKRCKRCTFISFFNDRIYRLEEENRIGTVKTYACARNSFIAFTGKKNLPFSALTRALVENYEVWLKSRGVSRNTISFYMRILRSVYNQAVEASLVVQNYPFTKVYTGVDQTSKRAVGEDIIINLKNLDISYSHALSYARDLFFFSFYARGMAFVDMAYLKKDNIQGEYIQYVRRKTGQTIKFRLEPCMMEIIEKYASLTQGSEYLLPIICMNKKIDTYEQYRNVLGYYNKLLKRLSRLLGLPRPLTSYTARHTWATTARNKNIPLSVISAGMGHTSEATTRIYLDAMDTSIIDEANYTILKQFM